MINMNEFLDKYAPLRKLNYYKLKLKIRLGFLKVLFFLGGGGRGLFDSPLHISRRSNKYKFMRLLNKLFKVG